MDEMGPGQWMGVKYDISQKDGILDWSSPMLPPGLTSFDLPSYCKGHGTNVGNGLSFSCLCCDNVIQITIMTFHLSYLGHN